MCVSFLLVWVSVSCWLGKNNLDAFLFSSVFWNSLNSSTVISMFKLLKNSPSDLGTCVGA